ncbi:MAG: radical SAM protein [Deltaproteobacteria bacterium]|nr:radical SAM protein [Deltaproteobacteria bacterium]
MKTEHRVTQGEKTFRLIITEDCNANCPHCFNANMRLGKHMPMDIFYKALSCADAPSIKIMGGEPTLHPNLLEIIDACHEAVPVLRVFTNGLKKEVLDKADWHPSDTVTFNFYVANKNLTNQNYLWDKDISRTFHVVVNTKTDFVRLFNKLRNLAALLKKQPVAVQERSGIALSLDTQENIFIYKERLQQVMFNIVRRLRLWGFRHISRDHQIPECFWIHEDVREYLNKHLKNNHITACLSPNCASWIGIDGTIRHCNQFPVYCGKLSDASTPATIDSLYAKALDVKLDLLKKDHDCMNCIHLETCLGGCFKAYHLDGQISLHRLKCA